MDLFFESAPKEHVNKERSKARELRASQWWRQQLGTRKCYHCQCQFPLEELTMDHLIPIIRGGTSSKNNVVVSCKACNSAKGHLTRAELAMRSDD